MPCCVNMISWISRDSFKFDVSKVLSLNFSVVPGQQDNRFKAYLKHNMNTCKPRIMYTFMLTQKDTRSLVALILSALLAGLFS